jgi:tetratricopeptide (TPR) repeat protein
VQQRIFATILRWANLNRISLLALIQLANMFDPGNVGVTLVIYTILVVALEIMIRRSPDPSRHYSFRTRIWFYLAILVFLLPFALFPSIERALKAAVFVFCGLALILLVILLIVLKIGFTSTNQVFKKALELSERGRDWEAIALLEDYRKKARRLDKSFEAAVLTKIARLHAKSKDWAQALASIDQAIALNEHDAPTHSTKADILTDCGRLPEARELLESVQTRFARSVALQTAYAEILLKSDEAERANTVVQGVEALLAGEKFVDVVDRDDWMKNKIAPLRQAIAAKIPSIREPK